MSNLCIPAISCSLKYLAYDIITIQKINKGSLLIYSTLTEKFLKLIYHIEVM